MMITSKLKSILTGISDFSEDELELISSFFEFTELKKKDILLNEGEICQTIFLVESGVLRNYCNHNGTTINLSFTLENQFTTNLEAYINREPSKMIIDALQNSGVWVINSKLISRHYKSIPSVSAFIRRLAIRILLASEEHHNMLRLNSPADRYQFIQEKKPELLQKVSLTQLASYLGITRETLSRIRNNKY